VREFIDKTHSGRSKKNRFGIHFFEGRSAVFHFSAGYRFQALCLRYRVGSLVRFEVPNNHVHSLFAEILSFFEHAICFTGAGGVAQIDLQAAAAMMGFAGFRHREGS
jgi:hypothetical protein